MYVTKAVFFASVHTVLFGSVSTAPPESLKRVNVVFRHGDRSPTAIYPKDINQMPEAWPDGLGWLTNIGKMQHYVLGQYLRQRYTGFINTTHYNHEEILVQSSGVERCLLSAYCNLAGLYPPEGDQVWNPNILWQPIPVQTAPVTIDNKLAESSSCPRYDQLMQEVLNSAEIKKEELENRDFYEMVENSTGVKQESISDIWEVADTLICEKAHNMTWNDWVTDPVWAKLNDLKTQSFDLLFTLPEMAKLKGGPLLKEIIQNMASVTLYPKFYMYSAHDTTVASLLSAMKVFDLHQPMYRALVIIELHEVNSIYDVRIFYKNDTTEEPYELTVPGCSSPCTLDKFIELTKDRVPVDWAAECKAKDNFPSNGALTPASWIALSIGIGMCVAIAIAVIVMTVRLHKKRRANYSKI